MLTHKWRQERHWLMTTYLWWLAALLVIPLLLLDLGIFHRKAHSMKWKEALNWTLIWVSLAIVYGAIIWRIQGRQAGVEYLSGYLLELSLSADNVFVFALIFESMKIPDIYRHRILFWGIVSAILMRAVMIVVGGALIDKFHWLIAAFGVLLIITGLKMYSTRNKESVPQEGRLAKFLERHIPYTPHLHEQNFLAKVKNRYVATPLLLALIMLEVSDLLFALDSIPAIFGITQNRLIVFTSNIFAILGLRSLYFLLSGVMDKIHYLKIGLSAILTFVGVKMLGVFKIATEVSLLVIAGILVIAIVASTLRFHFQNKPAPDESRINVDGL